MTSHDPVLAELRAMFACYEGPGVPQLAAARRRGRGARRLVGAVALLALLVAVSVASADRLDLFDGRPVPLAVKQQIATSSEGAPPALDPGIDASTAVSMITLPTAKGTVSLVVSRATRATYCDGLDFSWLRGGPGLGCDGPVTPGSPTPPPIDIGMASPGILGTSPIYVYGYVRTEGAVTARLVLGKGGHVDKSLTHGFFLFELAGDGSFTGVQALAASGDVIATQDFPQHVIGLPQSTTAGP